MNWEQLDQVKYDGSDLGMNYTKEHTTFKVWAPTASKVELNLYTKGSEEEESEVIGTYEMTKEDCGVYVWCEKGDLDGIYYTYSVTVDGATRETADPYAKAAGVNGLRSMVVDLETTNPEGWELDQHVVYPLEDTEIWELHIGDFSNAASSGVLESHRGKYLAFCGNVTTMDDDGIHPTGISYIKDLGITHVHLLPTFDYASVDESKPTEQFNWGYDPYLYNVPEGSYATDAFDGKVRINEFKQMVMALHKAGISVVMDVVYNHTFSLDSPFQATVPGYYYRTREDGTYYNGSMCGNDTASDHAMFSKFMKESVLYWANEYHIDGFRFDLMGLHDVETMNEIRRELNAIPKVGKEMILYGEPWSAGESVMKKGAIAANKEAVNLFEEGILIFNDDIRDTIKGPFDKLEVPGFVNGKKGLEDDVKQVLQWGFSAENKAIPKSGKQCISYVSAHDNSTLWDKLVDSVKKDHSYLKRQEDLIARNRLAAAMVQFSKGVPFMQAGEEALRTKMGQDNTYNSSKELNCLDWHRMYEYEDVKNYYKGLITLRKEIPELKTLDGHLIKEMRFIKDLPEQVVGYEIGNVMVLFNASKEQVLVQLKQTWNCRLKGESFYKKGEKNITGDAVVEPLSTIVLEK